jgi:hypothetical protein
MISYITVHYIVLGAIVCGHKSQVWQRSIDLYIFSGRADTQEGHDVWADLQQDQCWLTKCQNKLFNLRYLVQQDACILEKVLKKKKKSLGPIQPGKSEKPL